MSPEKRKKSRTLVSFQDEAALELAKQTDQKILAAWAIACALRVLPYFADEYPADDRPRQAIEALQEWRRTGKFQMSEIRKASLDAHAAARAVGEDNAARSAARAAGQAVATAHVPTHALGAAVYALQAVYRATDAADADGAVARERDWQYQRLIRLREKSGAV